MKNKYNSIYSTYKDYNIDYKDYGKYINMADYTKQYNPDWVEYILETKEEKLAREKAEKRNDKINKILNG